MIKLSKEREVLYNDDIVLYPDTEFIIVNIDGTKSGYLDIASVGGDRKIIIK